MTLVEGKFKLGSKTARSNEELVAIYRNNIQRFGFDGRALLYPDNFLHKIKLEQYYKVLANLLATGDSILDIGCAYGSLVDWLKEHWAGCSYHGIDIVPEFIENARKTYNRAGVTFDVMDLEQCQTPEDWCILLGVVNSVPEPEKLVSLAWSRCKRGLIVDFNDIHSKYRTQYNEFDIELQKKLLRQQGAQEINEYPDLEKYPEEEYGWKILIARR